MATHILLEFKHTESVNENVFRQALGYDTFYKRAQNLTHGQVQTFVISSKKTQARTLAEFGYQATEKCGVYKSTHSLLNSIILISLNELSSEVHNSWLKCFASHMLEKKAAFGLVQNEGMRYLTSHLELFMNGLSKLIIGGNMSEVITPEVVMEMGRKSLLKYLPCLTVEERLDGLKPSERLDGLKPSERLDGLKPSERLDGLKLDEIEAYLKKRKKKN